MHYSDYEILHEENYTFTVRHPDGSVFVLPKEQLSVDNIILLLELHEEQRRLDAFIPNSQTPCQ